MRKSSKTNVTNCAICDKEFMSLKSKFCSTRCQNIHYSRIDSELLTGEEGIDFVTCRWCNMKAQRLYLSHIKTHHPGKTTDDYRKEFPGAPLSCSKDNKNVAKAFVRFTTSEEGKKFLSERVKGDKNPNSRINTTEDERKSRSPFSVSHYTKKGFTEEQAKLKISESTKEWFKDRITNVHPEYWLNKANGDKNLAEKMYKERQATFSLEKCIEKYGEEKGFLKWKERQDKWKRAVFNDSQWIGKGKSKVAEELFDKISDNDKNYKNEKFIRYSKDSSYKYDFCDSEKRRIIEFNGDFWHCNPILFNADYFHPVRKCVAKDLWDYDEKKCTKAEEHGYKVLTVWEKEYREKPEETVQKCINFLQS